jgi:ABC-type multidrug transport system ATPase subunit
MSEEILKALMELFALIVKQDGGILSGERDYVADFLSKQLTRESVNDFLALFDQKSGAEELRSVVNGSSSPSVNDSVKILGICKKINRTLNQEQKVVVLIRLFELVNRNRQFTGQRMNIINTVAEVFNISPEEYSAIEQFIKNDDPEALNNPAILSLLPGNENCILYDRLLTGYQGIKIFILRVKSVELYFIRYISSEQLNLNGLPIRPGYVYPFAKGGSVKSKQGRPIYYSDISSSFLSDITIHKISFDVRNLNFNFREGKKAIDNISFSVEEGRLIGILGASGSGKTTLLNLISGIQKPASGSVTINGLDVFRDTKKLEGVCGYVPQDDVLIDDLTVFENLFFAARQCFGNKSVAEITGIVDKLLSNLGLFEKRCLRVGSPLNKIISGGQRKRLNIALELIREPRVLFLDEPTSGLSSRDSENLMDLLRDLTLKGQLIFTVIHQPSSEVFKMFDKVVILDQNGCMAYFGNPVDAVTYFKTLDAQINSDIGECPSCGNVDSEAIFNIIESQVVDEFGKYTEKRKTQPEEWADIYRSRFPFEPVPEVREAPVSNLRRPGPFGQFMIYLMRDLKSKIANRQYVLLTLLEAPFLGFILSFIIRYIPDPDSHSYLFSENENIPVYIFMSLIVALFLGLTISAEEIYRDRKILKREHFLNLSRASYLGSKIVLLIFISAMQTLLFVAIANPVLGIKGMFFNYWIALFTTAFCANMLGLNISDSFNSAITIYIVIPLLIIPMMVLSGAMFPFDKLNRKVGSVEKVPLIAELMPTRWTYEALMVSQFKDNLYSKVEYDREHETYYMLQKKISEAEFNKIYRLKALRDALENVAGVKGAGGNDSAGNNVSRKGIRLPSARLLLLKNELSKIAGLKEVSAFNYIDELVPEKFNRVTADSLSDYLDRLDREFSNISNAASDRKDNFYRLNEEKLKQLENDYYNYKLLEVVTKPYERDKILIHKNSIVQNTDPVYLDPDKEGFFDFRTHFYAPVKFIFGIRADTFVFNISLVLFSTIILYITLYFGLLRKAVSKLENLKFRK